MDPEERSPAGGSVEASQSHQTSVAGMAWVANVSPVEFEKKPLVSEEPDACGTERASTCRSKGAKGERIEKVYDYVIACSSPKGKISQMEVVEDFESRPHKAASFLVERDKETQEWNEQKQPKVLPGYSGGRLPGGSVKEKGREEGVVDEGSGEWKIRQEIAQEVVVGIKEKASVQDDA